MKKVFVLDTCVLIYSPQALFKFQDNEVIIPMGLLEEIDSLKNKESDTGRNARQVSRYLDELRLSGSLFEGIPTKDGGTIKVKTCGTGTLDRIPAELQRDKVDNAILATALRLKEEGRNVILVSKDINMRIKAEALEIPAEDYKTGKVDPDEYEGVAETVMNGEEINHLFQDGVARDGFLENECLTVRNSNNLNQTVLAIHKQSVIKALPKLDKVSKIEAKNREQQFAFHLLLDDSIPLVTISGIAGTGKTLCSLAAGLQKVGEGKYDRVLVTRPTVSMGKEIGFLPGDLDEKMNPWMQPIFDNIGFICGEGVRHNKRRPHEDLIEQGILKVECLSYIRGRSLNRQFIICDESQNLSPLELKTLITRVAEGSKLVLLGDPSQIDVSYLDSGSNGLSIVAEKFRDEALSGHVRMYKGERSALSELAAKLL